MNSYIPAKRRLQEWTKRGNATVTALATKVAAAAAAAAAAALVTRMK